MDGHDANTTFDIGANLTHSSFGDDIKQVLDRAAAAGVSDIVVTGTSVEGSRAALALAQAHPQLHATAGVPPHDAANCDAGTLPALKTLLADPKVVAVGECGLD